MVNSRMQIMEEEVTDITFLPYLQFLRVDVFKDTSELMKFFQWGQIHLLDLGLHNDNYPGSFYNLNMVTDMFNIIPLSFCEHIWELIRNNVLETKNKNRNNYTVQSLLLFLSDISRKVELKLMSSMLS